MWALDGALGSVDKSALHAEESGSVALVFPSFLIEHQDGLVVFDTGLDPEAATDPAAVYGPLAEFMNLEYRQDQRLDSQIEALGFRLDDVQFVVLSHLHLDHTGGVGLFPGATFLVGAGERSRADDSCDRQEYYFRQQDLDVSRQFRWQEVEIEDYDLFGDGSVTLLSTPGHTEGHMSLLVRLSSQSLILSGDATHERSSLVAMRSDLSNVDAQQSVKSLEKLRSVEAATDAPIWVCHDPDDWSSFGAPRCFE